MKISDVIAALQAVEQEHGPDIPVGVDEPSGYRVLKDPVVYQNGDWWENLAHGGGGASAAHRLVCLF